MANSDMKKSKVGYEFYKYENEDTVQYHYHNTCIVEHIKGKEYVVLNTGGYITATTKNKINQALKMLGIPVKVFQRNFYWYINNYAVGRDDNYLYNNGMKITFFGSVVTNMNHRHERRVKAEG